MGFCVFCNVDFFDILRGIYAILPIIFVLSSHYADMELFFGSLVYCSWQRCRSRVARGCWVEVGRLKNVLHDVVFVLGASAIIFSAIFISKNDLFPGYVALFPVVGSGVILFGASGSRLNRFLLSNRPMLWIGRISYPLYLWHWPILCYGSLVFGRGLSENVRISLVFLSILLAAITHIFVEQPTLTVRRGGLAARRPLILASLALLLCFLVWKVPGNYRDDLRSDLLSVEAAMGDWKALGGEISSVQLSSGERLKLRLIGATNSTPSVLLVGDSHVEQYWPLFVDRNNSSVSHSFALFSKGGCLPMPLFERVEPGHGCERFGNQVKSLLDETKAEVVIVGAYWEGYFCGAYEAKKQMPLVKASRLAGYSEADTVSLLKSPAIDEFELMLSRLSSRGVKVYLLMSNVSAEGFDPKEMIDRLSRVLTTSRDIDLENYNYYRREVVGKLFEIASRTGATVIDPSEDLCKDELCPTRDFEGKPFYSDSNHIRPFVLPRLKIFDEIFSRYESHRVGVR